MDHCRGAFSRLAALRLLAKRKLLLVAAPCQPRKIARDNGPLVTTGYTSGARLVDSADRFIERLLSRASTPVLFLGLINRRVFEIGIR
jgi:hypothetical protein